MKHLIITLAGIVGVAALACDFGEFEQSVNLKENIDDYRTGLRRGCRYATVRLYPSRPE